MAPTELTDHTGKPHTRWNHRLGPLPPGRCLRCGGSILDATCILCGEEAPEPQPGNGPAAQPGQSSAKLAGPLAADPTRWHDLALQELTTLITRIERLSAERLTTLTEARKLRHMLYTWGTPNLPHIPKATYHRKGVKP